MLGDALKAPTACTDSHRAGPLADVDEAEEAKLGCERPGHVGRGRQQQPGTATSTVTAMISVD